MNNNTFNSQMRRTKRQLAGCESNCQPEKRMFKLILSKRRISQTDLQYLIKHFDLSVIKELWLDHNNIDGRQLNIMVGSRLPYLIELHLNKNYIGSYGARCITNISMPHLAYLYINQNYLGNQGIFILTKSTWPNLKSLNLCLNDITEEGIRKIQNGFWKQLRYLDLGNNKIVVSAAVALASCYLPLIKRIFLPRPYVFVQRPPYLLPTHQEFEQAITETLPKSWGIQYCIQ